MNYSGAVQTYFIIDTLEEQSRSVRLLAEALIHCGKDIGKFPLMHVITPAQQPCIQGFRLGEKKRNCNSEMLPSLI